jgi:hypothetical protein
MSLPVIIHQLLGHPHVDRCLLQAFYTQLLASLRCYTTGAQCLLIDEGIRIQEALGAQDVASFHRHLQAVLALLEHPPQTQGPDAETMRCNLEILQLRVRECLGLCI